MDIITDSFSINTKGNTDILDITPYVQEKINASGLNEGSALVFAGGSTAGITTIEFEPGLKKDYPAFFEKIIPSNITYMHDETCTIAMAIRMYVQLYKEHLNCSF